MSAVQNAADSRQIRDAEKQQKLRRVQDLAAWRNVVKSSDGRRVLLNILEECNVFVSLWEPSAAIHRNEGTRIAGLRILEHIAEADVQALPAMLAEPWLRHARDESERRQEHDKQKSKTAADPAEGGEFEEM